MSDTGIQHKPGGIWYKLPPRFIRDCQECDCDVGEYSGAYLKADWTQLTELRNRAAFYADEHGPDATGDGGALKRSAKALLKAMRRLGV